MMDQYPHLFPLYLEVLQVKFEKTAKPYGRKEFDKLFMGKWNVSCNMPGSLLADDLIAAYPNAKIILTTRDVDKWLRSMKESVDAAVKWKSFDWLASWDTVRFKACTHCQSFSSQNGALTTMDGTPTGSRWTLVEIPQVSTFSTAHFGAQWRATGISRSLQTYQRGSPSGTTVKLQRRRGMGAAVQVPWQGYSSCALSKRQQQE
jgi:hypothetical protein